MKRSRELHYHVTWAPISGAAESSEDQQWFLLTPVAEDPGWGHTYPTLPYPVAVKLGKSEEGRVVCVGLRLGSDAVPGDRASSSMPITSQSLRDIPLAEVVHNLAAFDRLIDPSKLLGTFGDTAHVAAADHGKRRSRPGARGHPPEFYRHIADLYRKAMVVSPGHIYRYLVKHAKYPDGKPAYADPEREDQLLSREAAARRWVKKARDKGFLGPARRGKAGEYPEAGPSRESGHDMSSERKERP